MLDRNDVNHIFNIAGSITDENRAFGEIKKFLDSKRKYLISSLIEDPLKDFEIYNQKVGDIRKYFSQYESLTPQKIIHFLVDNFADEDKESLIIRRNALSKALYYANPASFSFLDHKDRRSILHKMFDNFKYFGRDLILQTIEKTDNIAQYDCISPTDSELINPEFYRHPQQFLHDYLIGKEGFGENRKEVREIAIVLVKKNHIFYQNFIKRKFDQIIPEISFWQDHLLEFQDILEETSKITINEADSHNLQDMIIRIEELCILHEMRSGFDPKISTLNFKSKTGQNIKITDGVVIDNDNLENIAEEISPIVSNFKLSILEEILQDLTINFVDRGGAYVIYLLQNLNEAERASLNPQNKIFEKLQSFFHTAILNDDITTVKSLLNFEETSDIVNDSFRQGGYEGTMLHWAFRCCNPVLANEIIKSNKFDRYNAKDDDGSENEGNTVTNWAERIGGNESIDILFKNEKFLDNLKNLFLYFEQDKTKSLEDNKMVFCNRYCQLNFNDSEYAKRKVVESLGLIYMEESAAKSISPELLMPPRHRAIEGLIKESKRTFDHVGAALKQERNRGRTASKLAASAASLPSPDNYV